MVECEQTRDASLNRERPPRESGTIREDSLSRLAAALSP
jgi:hypothetical protein